MDNPNIVFTRKDIAELVDRPVPEPAAGEVRVRLVRSCISSGTERANLIGVPDGGVGIFSADDGVTWPRQSGYSSSGVVDKVGDGVTSLKPGDRVSLSWSLHARYVVVSAANAYPVPDGVSFEHAALAHIATFPLAAIRKCRLELGEGAIVMGQGILGQLAVLLLKAAGAIAVKRRKVDGLAVVAASDKGGFVTAQKKPNLVKARKPLSALVGKSYTFTKADANSGLSKSRDRLVVALGGGDAVTVSGVIGGKTLSAISWALLVADPGVGEWRTKPDYTLYVDIIDSSLKYERTLVLQVYVGPDGSLQDVTPLFM